MAYRALELALILILGNDYAAADRLNLLIGKPLIAELIITVIEELLD